MSKFCRFWLQLSLIYNAIIAVESLFSQAWMMLGIAAISLWCLTLLMQGRLLDDVRDDFPDQCSEPRRSVV